MTQPHDSWDSLRSAWHSGAGDASLRVARATVAAAMRRSLVARTALVMLTTGMIAGALLHAADPVESALGLMTGAAAAAAWWSSSVTGRRTHAALAAAGDDYRALRAGILRAQIRYCRFVQLLLALQLVFFVPWWIGGFAVHRAEWPFGAVMLLAFWIPLAGMVALFSWARRQLRTARRELSVVAQDS